MKVFFHCLFCFLFLLLCCIPSLEGQSVDSLKVEFNDAEDIQLKFGIADEIIVLTAERTPDKALPYLRYNLKLSTLFPSVFDPVPVYNQSGFVYSSIGKPDSALFYLHKGFEKAHTDSIDQIILLSKTIGEVYFEIGAYDKALMNYFNALEHSQKVNDQESILKLYGQIANCYIELKYFNKAEEYFKRSIPYFKEQENKRGLMALYNNMGNLYGYKQQYDTAEIYFFKTLELSKEIGHILGEAYSLLNIGENFRRKGEIKKSLEYFKESEQLFLQNGIEYNLSGIRNNIGSAYMEYGNFVLAEKYLKEALIGAKKQNSIKQLKSIYKDLALLYENIGDFKNSLHFFKLSSNLKDSIFNDEKTKQIADMRIKYETEQVENELKTVQNEKLIQDLKLEQQENQLKVQRFIIFGIAVILILAALSSYFVFHNYRLKRQAEYSKLVKDHYELSLKFLRSQLNPHFIFNALGSIQSLILEENFDQANMYLGKFALLLRNILEKTSDTNISVNDELEISKLYLELEQMSHKGKFDFEIISDEEIDVDTVFIPPMILQPFLENALKHGISNLKEKGFIRVYLYTVNGSLQCKITDNGAGYTQSLLKANKTGRKSMGLQLVKDRLSKYTPKGNEAFRVEIKDISAAGTSGTEVCISLPYEERF